MDSLDGKAVDVYFAAIGSSPGARQRLEIQLQIVGVVRERIQIGAFDYQGVRVLERRRRWLL
jgi:hypothetical protein